MHTFQAVYQRKGRILFKSTRTQALADVQGMPVQYALHLGAQNTPATQYTDALETPRDK